MRLSPRSPAGVAAFLAAALLAVPTAAAQPVAAQLVAHDIRFEGASAQSGTLAFLFAVGDPGAPAAAQLHATGRHIDAHQYDNSGVEVLTSDLGGRDANTLRALGPASPPKVRAEAADAAQLLSKGFSREYQIQVFSSSGLPAAGSVQDAAQTVLQSPHLTRGGIKEAGDQGGVPLPSVPQASPPDDYWTEPLATGAHVLTEGSAGTLRIAGTFTIEVMGLDFHLEGTGTSVDLHSGMARDGLGPVPVGPLDAHLHNVRSSFLRITVSDGVLDIALPRAFVQWSGPAADTTAGAASLDDATGSVELADGRQQRLTGASYHLDGHYDVQANPSQQGLQLAVTGLDAQGQPLATASTAVRQAASPVYWVAAAAVAGSACATLLILALRRRQPTMAEIESALENGHFRRAAREAGRLLRRRPGFEDAVLSRAIALAKLGRNERVVREIRAHFAAQEPSDGVLHYVLGLALKETGAADDAQAALREALRRTPGLLPQVQPLLSGQQASSTASAVGPLVDGTAYA